MTGSGDGLVGALRAWRQAEARRRKVPSFCILTNRAIDEIARARPADERSLLGVTGVGRRIAEQYGAAILALVAR